MKEIRFNDRMWFGKYKGLRICEIIESNPNYINKILKENNLSLDEKSKDKLFGDKRPSYIQSRRGVVEHVNPYESTDNVVDPPTHFKIKKSIGIEQSEPLPLRSDELFNTAVGASSTEIKSKKNILLDPIPPVAPLKKYRISTILSLRNSFLVKHLVNKLFLQSEVVDYNLNFVSNTIIEKMKEINLSLDKDILLELYFLKNCKNNNILNRVLYITIIDHSNNNLLFDGQFFV